MKKETLSEAIGRVDDTLIEQDDQMRKKKIHWKRWAALAACLVLVVVGVAAFPGMGGNSAEPGMPIDPGAASGGSGGGYHKYTGPILPLTVLEGAERLGGTDRELVLDFERNGSSLHVTDRYILQNPTEEDLTVELLYPFVSSLWDLKETRPTLTVGGLEAETELLAGGYAGGFQGAGGVENDLNLKQPASFEEYAALLGGSAYLSGALEGAPDLSGTAVTVYKFTDPWGEEESGKNPNPTIRATFGLDYSKTTILSYGFNGGSNNSEKGIMSREYSIHYADAPCYLIVLGEDIRNLETQGYATGGSTTTQTIQAGVTVTRYKCALDEVLREIFVFIEENWMRQETWSSDLGELPYKLFCNHLLSYGLLSDNAMSRYRFGKLEETDFGVTDRIFYLKTEVVIPAGGMLEVAAVLDKLGSHNFYSKTKAERLYGYEIAGRLGSALEISSLHITFADREGIEFVEHNLNYDTTESETKFVQDPDVDRYYFHVKRTEP